MVVKQYPRRRNGDEYYTREGFLKDSDGRERYARDHNGNQLYPKWSKNLFARDKNFIEYYARDNMGNEFYPCVKGQSIVIPGQMAKFANGDERYPTDAKGNEYYLQANGKPHVLLQRDGSTYWAKSRKGIQMVPWNALKVTDDRPYICTRDAAGNCVYVHESDLSQTLKVICNCLCQCVSLCPMSCVRSLIGVAA